MGTLEVTVTGSTSPASSWFPDPCVLVLGGHKVVIGSTSVQHVEWSLSLVGVPTKLVICQTS